MKVDGQPVEAGRFIDLQEGEEIEFGDGKKYTISYGGERLFSYVCIHDCDAALALSEELSVTNCLPITTHRRTMQVSETEGTL